MSGVFLLLRAFCQWKIEHKLSTIFVSFSFFFLESLSQRRPESLFRPDAQYFRVVTVLSRV